MPKISDHISVPSDEIIPFVFSVTNSFILVDL